MKFVVYIKTCGVLSCDTMKLCDGICLFRSNTLPPSSGLKCAGSHIGFFIYTEITRRLFHQTQGERVKNGIRS
jgi:hypothetical protein